MKSTLVWAVGAILLCLLIEIFFFRGFLLQPNEFMFPFGGDGYFITYNMNYHAQHGEGVQLNSMNYPYGEVIFMTDANGVMSMIIQQLRDWGVPAENYVIGFMNVANYYLIPLCVLFLFLIFCELKLPKWYALLAALFVGLLSPQLIRIVSGHYALGFPFLLPMVFYWIMRARNKRSWYVGGFFVGLILLFFGLNNFYLLLIGAGFCLLTGVLAFFRLPKMSTANLSRRDARQLAITIALVGLLPLCVGFLFNESLSTHDDRVRVPYGFMRNFELLPSLLWPEHSLTLDSFGSKLGLRSSGVESIAYLGLVPIFIFLIVLFRAGKNRFRSWHISTHPYFNLIVIAGLLFLLLAAHFPFYGPLWELGNQLPVLPQFRAEQRLIWAFYYAFTILMAYRAYHYLKKLEQRPKYGRHFAATALGLSVVLWSLDVGHYLDKLNNDIFFPNQFTEVKNEEMRAFAAAHDLNQERYQGVYMLPTMNGWTDKVYHEGQWATYFPGMRFCVATGIPMINQMLSRVSVEQALQNLQFVSHPLIEREKLAAFPDRRPILLCKGEAAALHPREEWLFSQGDTVGLGPDGMILLAYDPWSSADSNRLLARNHFQQSGISGDERNIFVHFDEESSEHIFYGPGARHQLGQKDEQEIWSGLLPAWSTDSTYEASIWVYPDRDRQGLPHWYVQQWDDQNQIVGVADANSVKSYDTQNGWVRSTMTLERHPTATHLRLVAKHPTDFWCDEFLVRPVSDTITWQTDGETDFSINNFLVGQE